MLSTMRIVQRAAPAAGRMSARSFASSAGDLKLKEKVRARIARRRRRCVTAVRARPAARQPAGKVKYFKIYRWDPEKKEKPYLATYPVDLSECVCAQHERGSWVGGSPR